MRAPQQKCNRGETSGQRNIFHRIRRLRIVPRFQCDAGFVFIVVKADNLKAQIAERIFMERQIRQIAFAILFPCGIRDPFLSVVESGICEILKIDVLRWTDIPSGFSDSFRFFSVSF